MDQYLAFLEQDDERSRPDRARRLEIIATEFGPDGGRMFTGGLLAAEAFEEARHSYVRGLNVATVLLVQTTLEHLLAGLLHMSGRDGRWGFAEILQLALDDRLISANERDIFDGLRTLRNPYVHARLPLATGSLEAQAMADDTDQYGVMDADATLAITTLLRLIRRPPFNPGA
jgi:hypothetical protein